MNVKTAIEALHASEEFKTWQVSHKDAYLAHVFSMIGEEEAVWQVGYFEPADNLVYAFEIGEQIKINPGEAVFGPEGTTIDEVKIDDIKIPLTDALDTVKELQHKKYPNQKPVKKIIVLQSVHEHGMVYNITYVTQEFKTLNIKVDATTGKVVEDKLVEIFKFQK